MRVSSAEFLKSALHADQYPRDRRKEVAFVGRSNVGKSSLMNRLMGKKGLAKTSSRPGKTQTINFFDINRAYYFVDLPGYGYAEVPKAVKRKWAGVLTEYLSSREFLTLVVQLVDARHKPTQQDLDMLALLDGAEVPALVVATKIDKVPRGRRKQHLERIRQTLELDADALILPVSATTGDGIRKLQWVISDVLTGSSKDRPDRNRRGESVL